jgi:2-methylisocitrate lyase-like PEP mutase family enzyme
VPGGAGAGIYPLAAAVERIEAAAAAAAEVPGGFVLTARAEGLLRDPDAELGEVIERLQAFEAAGADVLYAPRLRSLDAVREVCAAVERPVNVLVFGGATTAEIFDAGAQRISLGGALAFTAVAALAEAAAAIREEGSFAGIRRPPAELNDWLA